MDDLTDEELWARIHERKAAAKQAATGCHRVTCRAKGLLGTYNGSRRMATCERCRDLKDFRTIESLDQP